MAEKIPDTLHEPVEAYYEAIKTYAPRERCILLMGLAKDMLAMLNGYQVQRQFEEEPSPFQAMILDRKIK